MEEIAARNADAEAGHADGISIDYDDWHVRPFNTEPLQRLNLESLVSQEHMDQKGDEVLGLIGGSESVRAHSAEPSACGESGRPSRTIASASPIQRPTAPPSIVQPSVRYACARHRTQARRPGLASAHARRN
jgi:hypothetical protein